MDVIPQATPLYATDGQYPGVFQVIGWIRHREDEWSAVVRWAYDPDMKRQFMPQERKDLVTFHATLGEAHEEILSW